MSSTTTTRTWGIGTHLVTLAIGPMLAALLTTAAFLDMTDEEQVPAALAQPVLERVGLYVQRLPDQAAERRAERQLRWALRRRTGRATDASDPGAVTRRLYHAARDPGALARTCAGTSGVGVFIAAVDGMLTTLSAGSVILGCIVSRR